LHHKTSITIRYILFCFIAILINLAIQRIIISSFEVNNIYLIAIILGTIGGLVSKYILDKQYIFYDIDNSLINNQKKFSLYSINGIYTTILFWITESAFYYFYQTEIAREIGAVLGLSIGYIIKYQLDKKYVFNKRKEAR